MSLSQATLRRPNMHETRKRLEFIGEQRGKSQSGPVHCRLLHNMSDSSSPLMQSLKLSQTDVLSIHRPWPHRNAVFGHNCGWQNIDSSSPAGQSRTWLQINDVSMQWPDCQHRNSLGLWDKKDFQCRSIDRIGFAQLTRNSRSTGHN